MSRSARTAMMFVAIMLVTAVMASKCGSSSVRPDRKPATPAVSTSQFMGTK